MTDNTLQNDKDECLDKLLAYLADSLDEKESEEVRRRVEEDPEWRKAMDEAQAAFRALESWKAPEPPAGLAVRTNRRIDAASKGRSRPKVRAVRFTRFFSRVVAGVLFSMLGLGIIALCVNGMEADTHDTVIVAEKTLVADSPGALRVVIRDGKSLNPVKDASVRLALEVDGKEIELASATTDDGGAISSHFTLPDVEPGIYYMIVETQSDLGYDYVRRQVKIERPYAVMLTTDKPLYRPDAKEKERIVKIRALALRKPNLKPNAGAPVTIEIRDPEGNRVFKHEGKTSEYGLAWCEYSYPEEAPLGAYRIEAKVGEVASERMFRMSRYVLPKFDVGIETDKPWYGPGDMMKLTVDLRYFFGEPVKGARLSITTDPELDVPPYEFEEDENGRYVAALKLPDTLAGTPFDRGDAAVTLRLRAEDTANQTVEKSIRRVISSRPVRIGLVPESGTLVNAVDNIVYLVLSTPDGRPFKGDFEVRSNSNKKIASGATDDTGVAEFILPAGDIAPPVTYVDLSVIVTPPDMDIPYEKIVRLATAQQDYYVSYNMPVLLRTDRTVYKAGQSVKITGLTAGHDSVLFLDVVQSDHTVLTQTVPFTRGKGTYTLDLPPDLSGTLALSLYRLGGDGVWARDTKIIYVEQPGGLKIEADMKKDTYRPRETASIIFKITDDKGRPTQAALSLSVVDEALLAIAEEHPGLAQAYFTIEREMLKPGVEVHGLASPESLIMAGPEVFSQVVENASFGMLESAVGTPLQTSRTYGDKVSDTRRFRRQTLNLFAWLGALGVLIIAGTGFAWLIVARKYVAVAFICGGGLVFLVMLVLTAGASYKMAGNAIMMERAQSKGAAALGEDMGWEEGKIELASAERPGIVRAGEFAEQEYERTASKTGLLRKPKPIVREEFPETLFWLPQVITDEKGVSEPVEITMADSITTWRMLTSAVSKQGRLGALEKPITVFQPFFADIDLPVSLTQNDEITIPVVVHNHLKENQVVALSLTEDEGFEILDDKAKTIELKAHEVGATGFTIRVTGVGKLSLKIEAEGTSTSGKIFADAIRREIPVEPDGTKIEWAVSDRLTDEVSHTFRIPDEAIPGSENLFLKIYPGTFSQVVEGLDSMLQRPYGCFEQTSSATHPNILVLDYLRETRRSSPEIEMKALSFIQAGYQRLLGFEVGSNSGSFSLYGEAPPSVWLTAYGLMEFADMSRVHDVDPALLARTRNWLASQQRSDGSFSMNGGYTAHGQGGGDLKVTAFCAWAMAEQELAAKRGGKCSAELARAISFLNKNIAEIKQDGYLTALTACAAVKSLGAGDGFAKELLAHLKSIAMRENKAAKIPAKGETLAWGYGEVANTEATALAAIAALEAQGDTQFIEELMTSLVRGKDTFGGYYSTQATVMALKALALASRSRMSQGEGPLTVNVLVSGQSVKKVIIPDSQRDVVQFVSLKSHLKKGENTVSFALEGKGKPCYQLVQSYYVPWKQRPQPQFMAPVSVEVDYDRTTIARGGVIGVTATIRNTSGALARMVMVDVGVPPGFSPERADLDALVRDKKINRYEIPGRQVILYLSDMNMGEELELGFGMRAKFLVKAKARTASAWPYYDPQKASFTEPAVITVEGE